MADGLSSVLDRDQLERGFRRLSIDHRAVVVLHHYLDLPLDDGRRRARRPRRDGQIPTTSRDAWPARGPRGRRQTGAAGGCPMSTDRDVTRIVRSWLEDGATVLPDRVLDSVLDQLPATPQRRAPWPARRFREMNTPIRLGVAAAALAVVAVVGLTFLPRSDNGLVGAVPSSTPSLTPSASPADGFAGRPPRGPADGRYLCADPLRCGRHRGLRGTSRLHRIARGRLDPLHRHGPRGFSGKRGRVRSGNGRGQRGSASSEAGSCTATHAMPSLRPTSRSA